MTRVLSFAHNEGKRGDGGVTIPPDESRVTERREVTMVEVNYDRMISEIEKAIAGGGTRINGMTSNVNRAISVLSAAHPKGLPAAERDALLSFEALCVESLWRTAWMFHERGEHHSARLCLTVGRTLQDAVAQAMHH